MTSSLSGNMGAVAMYAHAAFLALLALVTLTTSSRTAQSLAHFQKAINGATEHVYVYKYSASVSAGQNEPAPYASKFQIQGKLILKPDSSDPALKSAQYAKFQDIKHTVYNGADDDEAHVEYQVLDNEIKDFEEPILIVYDESQNVVGIKVQEKEATWSKNMKKSLASLMQFQFDAQDRDLSAFQKTEKTIHGDCQVDYNLYTDERDGKKLYYVRKVYEPRSCSKFVQHVVSDVKTMGCRVEKEEDLLTSAERIYEFTSQGDVFIMKKVVTHEKLSYLPWLHRSSEIQFIETNQTFEFENIVKASDMKLPVIDFGKVPITQDITFDKSDYVPSTASENKNDFSRHKLKPSDLSTRVKNYLVMAMDYLKENHIDIKEAQKDNKNVLQKLHHAMTYLDTETMLHIYKLVNLESEKGNMIRKMFLEMIPHTGTYAAWNFTKTIILNQDIPKKTATYMLAELPMYVQNPKEELAKDMMIFREFEEEYANREIQRAGLLCYSILLNKIYKGIDNKNVPEFLQQQLTYFNERIRFAPTYHHKIVHIMGMKNIEVGGIYKYLAPIVRGEDVFFVNVDIQKPEKYRIAAMWAVAKSISQDRELTYNLFWPILSNATEPLTMRVTAYELLVSRNPLIDMNLLMNVHWLMTEERDEHMFNYHYTTIRGMSESTDPCIKEISEMMRKVMRLTKPRKVIAKLLSGVEVFDYFDTKYGYGETIKYGGEIEESTGIPQFGYYEQISTFTRQPRLETGVFWNIDGINSKTIVSFMSMKVDLLRFVSLGTGASQENATDERAPYEITDENVRKLLSKLHAHKLLNDHIHLELWWMDKGYVTEVNVFFETGLADFMKGYLNSYKLEIFMDSGEKFIDNFLDISYLNHYRMVVPTEIGFPAFFYNEVPQMSYLKIKRKIYPAKTVITMNIQLEIRYYHHSSYNMKFYNPFADFMHSVQKHIVTDGSLPIDITASYNLETHSLKLVLPRVLETRFSVTGVKIQSLDQVEISNDNTHTLKSYCAKCKHTDDITKGPLYKKRYENVLHSLDTGLEYSYTIFDCENSRTPVIENEEWFRIFNTQHNNVNDNLAVKYLMLMDHGLFHFVNAPFSSNCGIILKASPCTFHNSSSVEMNWRFSTKNVENALVLNVRGDIDVKSSTNQSIRFWEINSHVAISQFHNDVNIELTRKTPEEKDLRICLQANKVYPNHLTSGPAMKHETKTKIKFTMGELESTQKNNCVQDETLISVNMKGELLDEQIEQMKKYVSSDGACFKNPLNPLNVDYTQRLDWNCLHEIVKGSTLRKYSIDVAYKKVPGEFMSKLVILDDYLRLENLPRITYKVNHTEPGNLQALVTFAVNNNYGNITVINPFLSYELVGVQYGSENDEDRHNDLSLDNTIFSTHFLVEYYRGEIRPCIVHANDMITDLNQTVPIDLKDWTLMLGDHELMVYAIFVKAVGDGKVAMRMYVSSHVLEIQPGKSKPIVTLDGTVTDSYDKDEASPLSMADELYFNLSTVHQMISVETEKYAHVNVYYTPHNVIIMPQIILDRNIDGMCGHMGSISYVQSDPLVLQG